MNHREPPHLPVETRRALHYIALLLLPGLAPTHTHATGRTRATGQLIALAADSTPYLLAVGAPPLRFREAAPPSQFTQRPPAGASPLPGVEASVIPPLKRPDALVAQPPAATAAAADSTKLDSTSATNPQPSTPAIIPDDTTPTVRPEDFLPFFQVPGSANAPAGVSVIAPVPQAPRTPAAIPVSSATYTQSPR